MHPYPHRYIVNAAAAATGSVNLSATGLPELLSAPPVEFDGPGDQWSPEGLLCAALADCFILTFRAIARISKFDWQEISCRVEGVLERAEGVAQFTGFTTHALLKVPPGTDLGKAHALMEKAEKGCLIANSVRGTRQLLAEVQEVSA
jgi:organic hydroperoxide reductase OsmC/OhrA